MKFNVGDVVKFKASKIGCHWIIECMDGPEPTYALKAPPASRVRLMVTGVRPDKIELVKKAPVDYWR